MPGERTATGYQQGFTTQDQELSHVPLDVTGPLPTWLQGTLVRNGPGKFEVGQQHFRHWFDGLAMLHAFTIESGNVQYTNKFIDSPSYRYAQAHQQIGYSEFATDPCRSIFKRMATLFTPQFGINTSVSVSKLAERFVAWTEMPLPIEFDPQSLRTVGLVNFADDLKLHTATPHPHLDPASGDTINVSLQFGATSSYMVYTMPPESGRRALVARLPVRKPAYMHSFALTESYVILAEYPLVVNPLRLLLSGKPFAENLHWQPEQGTHFLVIRKTDGVVVGRYPCPAFFCFHHVNAFERDDELIVDLIAYPDADVIRALYLDVLREPCPEGRVQPPNELRRYRVSLTSGQVSYEKLSDEWLELPRVNYERCHMRDYRFVYGIGLNKQRPDDFSNQLVKVDVEQRTARTWFVPDCYPGEPVFVAAPHAQAEDEGVVLSVVLDARESTSFLLVLDGRTFTEIARAAAPHRIPFGFHGQFFAD